MHLRGAPRPRHLARLVKVLKALWLWPVQRIQSKKQMVKKRETNLALYRYNERANFSGIRDRVNAGENHAMQSSSDELRSADDHQPNLRQRDELIEEYMRYVRNLAAMMISTMELPRHIMDDLVAGGLLGLVEAAERFDFKAGSNFKTFSFHRIRGAMIDSIRRCSDFSGKAYRAVRSLEAYASIREEYTHARNLDERRDKKQRLQSILNLVANGALAYRLCFCDEEEAEFAQSHLGNAEQMLAKRQSNKEVLEMVETLPDKERLIVEEYYLHGLSFSEIAKKYPNLSKSWISRLHKRALDQLRMQMLEAWGEARA